MTQTQKKLSLKEILDNAPMDDEEVTTDDLYAIIDGEAQIARGEFVRLEDIELESE